MADKANKLAKLLTTTAMNPIGGTPQGYLKEVLDFGRKTLHGAMDVSQPEFQAHADWYEKELPGELDKHTRELGMIRTDNSPRDYAAEFAGGADYAMRTKDYDRALENSQVYQTLSNVLNPLNIAPSIAQDKAGIEWARKNPNATRRQAVEAAVKYATE